VPAIDPDRWLPGLTDEELEREIEYDPGTCGACDRARALLAQRHQKEE